VTPDATRESCEVPSIDMRDVQLGCQAARPQEGVVRCEVNDVILKYAVQDVLCRYPTRLSMFCCCSQLHD
jgi:hypothetical protein